MAELCEDGGLQVRYWLFMQRSLVSYELNPAQIFLHASLSPSKTLYTVSIMEWNTLAMVWIPSVSRRHYYVTCGADDLEHVLMRAGHSLTNFLFSGSQIHVTFPLIYYCGMRKFAGCHVATAVSSSLESVMVCSLQSWKIFVLNTLHDVFKKKTCHILPSYEQRYIWYPELWKGDKVALLTLSDSRSVHINSGVIVLKLYGLTAA